MPTRADGKSKEEIKRDDKVQGKIKKGLGFEPRKTITLFGDLNVPWLRADTPHWQNNKVTIDRSSSH